MYHSRDSLSINNNHLSFSLFVFVYFTQIVVCPFVRYLHPPHFLLIIPLMIRSSTIHKIALPAQIMTQAFGSSISGSGTFIPKKPVMTATTLSRISKIVSVLRLLFKSLFRMLL